MAKITLKKIVLPIPTEFLRHVTEEFIEQTKKEEDLTATTIPLVTRAKILVARKGIIITTFEEES